MIPAEPKTFALIYSDAFRGGYVAIPVIGWAVDDDHNVTVVGIPAPDRYSIHPVAIQTPEGVVIDYENEEIFENIDEWLAYMKGVPVDRSDPLAHARGGTTEEAESSPATGLSIQFGSKTYKTKSYWHHVDSGSIFEVEAEYPYPADEDVIKIKRDEFFALRKAGNPVIEPFGADDEADEAEEDEDEFDANDLV